MRWLGRSVPRARRTRPAGGIGLKIKPLFGLKKPRQAGKESRSPDAAQICAGAVDGTRMTELPRKITDDPYGAAILIRRLVMEQGIAYWRRYLTAFALMGVARRKYRRGRAQRQQDGAGLQPFESVPRPVLLLHDGVPDGNRAGETPGAAEHRSEQPVVWRAHAAGSRRQSGERRR